MQVNKDIQIVLFKKILYIHICVLAGLTDIVGLEGSTGIAVLADLVFLGHI